MPSVLFKVNIQELTQNLGEAKQRIQQELKLAVQKVASMTFSKTQELASENLKSTRDLYLQNLSYKEVADGVWIVALDEPALWIEEGRKAGSMVEDLLKRNAKTSKSGTRYKAIPFTHNRTPPQRTKQAEDLVKLIKASLKAARIPFSKIERNPDGTPRLGKLHTLNIASPYMSPRASAPALHGLTIFQTKTPKGNIRRDIMTFRTVSSKHKGIKWIHPGFKAKKFMDQALEWASDTFYKEILPDIMKDV